MALNVSNELMLLAQKIRRKTALVHITTSMMSHIELACVLRAAIVAFGKYKNRCFNSICT